MNKKIDNLMNDIEQVFELAGYHLDSFEMTGEGNQLNPNKLPEKERHAFNIIEMWHPNIAKRITSLWFYGDLAQITTNYKATKGF